jgi:DNA-binding MarR family transcriptional regulator
VHSGFAHPTVWVKPRMSGSTRKGNAADKPDAKQTYNGGRFVTAAYSLPPTTSVAALLDNGCDGRFRMLVNDLFTIASRMEIVRAHLGSRMGISGPQYSVLIAVAHLQGERGVSVGAVAQAMHVTSAFIASESGKLAQRRLLLKRPNPQDGRGVLLSLAPDGRRKLGRIAGELRAINDLFFGRLDASSFSGLSRAAAALVKGSAQALDHVAALATEPPLTLAAAE